MIDITLERKIYYVNEQKSDFYEYTLKNGKKYKQKGPFKWATADWNCDGDVYDVFGAEFHLEGTGEKIFLSPNELVDIISDEGVISNVPYKEII